ncbi:MAG TPA: DALR anticodon-binding domain-containing protein, partial [bacterium]|nr:DALR anticodon-binding domain-containing protein [bacterium]
LLMQMVRLIKDGQEFKMSKRAGVYVTLEELIDMVGLDVTRFFFLMHSNNKTMDFDLNLASEKSNKNPVFYVQYAHARICSILEKISTLTVIPTEMEESIKEIPRLMTTKKIARDELKKEEKELIKELIKWPEIIEEVAENYEVHKICFYAIALSDKFHDFYENCRVIDANNLVNDFRLNLIQATKLVLENTLKTLGVSAPEKM